MLLDCNSFYFYCLTTLNKKKHAHVFSGSEIHTLSSGFESYAQKPLINVHAYISSKFWLESSITSILYVFEQRLLWRVCACAQYRMNIRTNTNMSCVSCLSLQTYILCFNFMTLFMLLVSRCIQNQLNSMYAQRILRSA